MKPYDTRQGNVKNVKYVPGDFWSLAAVDMTTNNYTENSKTRQEIRKDSIIVFSSSTLVHLY